MTSGTVGQVERSRNPRGQGVRLRDEILDTARELLGEGEPITLRSIARRAGFAAPSIYRHFPDVDSIMATVAEDAFADLAATLRADLDDLPAERRLREIAARYLDYAQQHPQHYALMFGGVWNAAKVVDEHPERAERLNQLGLNALAVLVEAIEACVAEGVSASTDPFRDATALWVALHGFAQQREAAPLFVWPEGLPDTLVTSLAHLGR
ncbi:TetR/AcrR family transcriptional regulator [Diaminobutyricimonas aerilata]|uniref:TetR/AcrR family transcriptional regulator n=1 Tax=Diaminobutyricimonas aerilata TaxID=1162967 RepID=UPI001B809D4B|nr:TetR/AcrR family transcriptional regulator [Diaminobutyricimonas aerilata]